MYNQKQRNINRRN